MSHPSIVHSSSFQAMTGVACPFISCIPTKVSQQWFGEEQRTLATILVGMSTSMGLVLGSAVTPLIVTSPERVPIMNIVWFVPAALGALLTMWKVTRNRPPTPPSLSAAQQGAKKASNASYLRNIRSLVTNVPFFIAFLFVGGAMGYVSTISTKIEQGSQSNLSVFPIFRGNFISDLLEFGSSMIMMIDD